MPALSVSDMSQLISTFLSSLCSQASQNPHAHTSLHPSIPSSSLPSAVHSYPASAYLPPLAANPVATASHPVNQGAGAMPHANLSADSYLVSSFPNALSFPPRPPPIPTPSLPQHPNVFPLCATSYTLATATPPIQPASLVYRPSPVSLALRQQILLGNYVDLAQLLHPSIIDTSQPREIQTNFGLVQLQNPSPQRSKDLTPAEFALAFSLYRDVICSVYPTRRPELDEYLRIELDMALRFGGSGFYTYHIHFASQAAGRINQFNQGTYWGALDSELYCRIFAARASLSCQICEAPSHPATACSVSAPQPEPPRPRPFPSRGNASVPDRLSFAAPPPSIIPRAAFKRSPANAPALKGVDRHGRPVLYQGGRMVCNNFNDLGCSLSSCRLMHICSFCGGAHARSTCPHNPTTPAD